MTTPFYVSPEQLMKDRADFARKGIARGRSVVVVQYADGLLFVAENQSQALHKISEIYDRIAFAAVGRYNEFENLRIAGVRLADMRGYAYDRRDVTGRGLANAYAQTLGTIFSSGGEKPYEVEIFVAEVGSQTEDDQVYRLTYDGSVADEQGYAVMGGSAEVVSTYLKEHYQPGMSLDDALRLAVDALGHDAAQVRRLTADRLEVAVLDRTRVQPRKFRRLATERLAALFGTEGGEAGEGSEAAAAEEGAEESARETNEHDPGASTQGGAVATDANAAGSAEGGASSDSEREAPPDTDEAGRESEDAPDDPSDVLGDLPDDPDQRDGR
jgi:proteasome alpha subunit